MKNIEQWKPSKFVVKKGRLCITKDPRELGISSRLSASVVVDAFNRHFLEHCKGSLLDLGCGKVPFYEFYRAHIKDSVCVDWENSAHGRKHIDVACDLSKTIALPNARFDTILLSSVLEHIPEPIHLWQEMSRLLKPKGKAIINVPFLYWLHEVPHDYFRYTEYALRRMAEESGFDIVVLEPLGGAPVVICDIAAKVLIRIPFLGSLLSSFVQGCCRVALCVPASNRILKRTAKLFPSGYFVVAQRH